MSSKSSQSSTHKPSAEYGNKGSSAIAGDRPQTSPDLFEKGTLTRVTSSLPIWEASNILTQSQHLPWTTDPDGKLIYSRNVNGGKGAICFRVAEDTKDEHPSTLAGAAALAVIDTFDMRAACMHLIFAAYASQMEKPWEEELVIDDRQLESYLGLQRRTDKNRREKLELIEEIVKQPCKITTYISWPHQGRNKGFTVEEGRLWHLLATRYHYQQDIFGEEHLAGISFVVKAGLWAKYFLNDEDAQEHYSPSSKGVLSKSLLENVMSLWQHRAGAARLMVWLLFKFQLNRLYTIPVRTLMEVAYGAGKVSTAKQDNQLRKKLTNTWDEDLLALHDRGWQIEFDARSYPSDIQPPGFGRENARRPRGFFDQLLKAQLEIRPPESWNLSQLESASEPSDELATKLTVPTLTGVDVKSQRTTRGWSQRRLATLTGISQGLISMIENETRTITEANESILKQTFDFM